MPQKQVNKRNPPERLQWAVSKMKVAPSDHILEVGCGVGYAADLIASKLKSGRLVVLDRSVRMIEQTMSRVTKTGHGRRVQSFVGDVGSDCLEGKTFGQIFIFNVNVFWSHSTKPLAEILTLKRLLKAGGQVLIGYQFPPGQDAKSILTTLEKNFVLGGFKKTKLLSDSAKNPSFLMKFKLKEP